LALVGLAVGQSTTVQIPPGQAYGVRDPERVRQLDRRRFPSEHAFVIGEWTRAHSHRGPCLVRVLEVREDVVIVDGNPRGAGQALELKVKLLTIQDAAANSEAPTAQGPSAGDDRPAE
jgi:FKBP-type peptidyl-prolyl cis-trans isomerase SlyD